jgi:hypothetical protein
MSARFTVLSALLVCVSHSGLSAEAGAETFAPAAPPIANYKLIWERMPFIVETLPQAPQERGLVDQYKLVGLVTSSSDSVAFIDDQNQSDPLKRRIMLSRKRPDRDSGLELVSISASPDIAKSSVLVQRAGKQATLPFDTEALKANGMGALAIDPTAGAIAPPSHGGVLRSPLVTPGTIPAPAAAQGILRQPPPTGQGNAAIPPPAQANPVIQPPTPSNPAAGQVPSTPTRRIIRPKPINAN